MKLEVIATSVEDVKNIAKSKADRIEYCVQMKQGGLTPKVREVKAALLVENHQPINVMIRPSARNFYYSWCDYLKMKIQVKRFGKTAVNGLVFGVLMTKTNKINEKRMQKLVKIANHHHKEVVFHRAIDLVPSYEEALTFLADLGIKTILTTGGQDPITNNLKNLDYLRGMKKVQILGGSGVDSSNALVISQHVDELHIGSAARKNGWASPIDVEKINQIKAIISENLVRRD